MKEKRFLNSIKKFILSISIVAMLLSGVVWADELPKIRRLEGKNRVETSIALSREAFKDKSETAIIVGYHGEVDALTGTLLAEKKQAPILISFPKELGSSLREELKRLGSQEIFILGGPGAVDKDIESELRDLGLDVTRLEGKSREDTAIDIARQAIEGEVNEAFLSLGYREYADALAIGPVAAKKNLPLLLSQTDKISDSTLDYIDSLDIKLINIIGGENAVSSQVEEILKSRGIETRRIEGRSREETAISIARTYIENPEKIIMANGYKYADAVVGGYLAAKENSPILLSQAARLKPINSSYLKENKLDINILGGISSIDANVLREIEISLGLIEEKPIEVKPPLEDVEEEEIGEPENLKELGKVISSSLSASQRKIDINYRGRTSLEKLSEDVRNILRDFTNNGSYEAGNIYSTRYNVSRRGSSPISKINLNVEYLTDEAQEAFVDREVSRITKSLIRPEMSDFQKLKILHDYIVNNSSYSYETKSSPHSAYTLFKEGKGVCQAYALASYKLLDAVGIDNYYVKGVAGSENHAWNKVKLDGEWYNLDVTWDDPISASGEDILSYDYFLISDKKLAKSHRPDKNNFPPARDEKYEVFRGIINPIDYKEELYYVNREDGGRIYSLSLENLTLRKVSDNVAPYLQIHQDRIYFSNYSDGGYLSSMDLEGNDLEILNSSHSTNLKLELPYLSFYNNREKKWDRIEIE